MNTIYERIKQRRLELKMTQQDLADKLGYKSGSAVNKVEQGINTVNQIKIVAYAKALETTPAYLMGWVDTPDIPKEKSSPLQEELNRKFKELPEEQKKQAIEYIEFLLRRK